MSTTWVVWAVLLILHFSIPREATLRSALPDRRGTSPLYARVHYLHDTAPPANSNDPNESFIHRDIRTVSTSR